MDLNVKYFPTEVDVVYFHGIGDLNCDSSPDRRHTVFKVKRHCACLIKLCSLASFNVKKDAGILSTVK